MDRQRNFSFKPTRLLVLSFTISSSVIFIVLFTIWVTKATPLVPTETHFQVNTSSLTWNFETVAVETLTGLGANSSSPSKLKGSILNAAQLQTQENTSGVSEISSISGLRREKIESEVVEEDDSTSASDVEIEVPTSEILNSGQLRKQENISGVSEIPIIRGVQREKVESEVVKGYDGLICNLTSAGCEENEARSGEKIEESNSTETVKNVEKKRTRKCDVTRGKWVYDESYPLYINGSCPFIDEGFDCIGNGRVDKGYMKLRWQPQDCDFPRFNATRMLEQLRGKRLVFVGDSINRNQWESMLCMLMGGVKDPKKVYETRGRRITKEKGNYSFKFMDYECTVEYYVTHFLVHEGKARVEKKRVQTLQIDTIDRGSSRWKGANILIFNTAHWWSHFKTKAGFPSSRKTFFKSIIGAVDGSFSLLFLREYKPFGDRVNYYQEAGQVHPRLDVNTAFRKSLMTWASWVDKHINPGKTRVFFRSSAPSHFRGGQWNSGGHCREATLPLLEISSSTVSEKNIIVEEVIREMKTPVTVLNISALSDYRIDGHPSSYGKRPGNQYSSRIQDCSHWCLPGVPDSWNELLYAYLQSKPGMAGFRFHDQ